jgi:hypothetical protein
MVKVQDHMSVWREAILSLAISRQDGSLAIARPKLIDMTLLQTRHPLPELAPLHFPRAVSIFLSVFLLIVQV